MDQSRNDRVFAAFLIVGYLLINDLTPKDAIAADRWLAERANVSPSETGILRVATLNGATTYYVDRHKNEVGPEFSLTTAFARRHGWTIEWTAYDSTEQLLQALIDGDTHLAAAGLTQRPSLDAIFIRGPTHTHAVEQLVCHRSMDAMPKTPDDLVGVDVSVVAKSGHAETLSKLAAQNRSINFQEDSVRNVEQLLRAVAENRLGCTVVDSHTFEVMRRRFPHLTVAMEINGTQPLGWYFPVGADELAEKAERWMNGPAGRSALTSMASHYYDYISEFDFVDLRALSRRIQDRLPQYIERFAEAEASTGIPADLLAALSYQESHWDPNAISPTGVRGIMMLTQGTAGDLGVDRLDPVAAIEGGARYLADRHRRLPDSIVEPDRTFMALASYNVGLGHILDARRLAEERGLDPDSWDDVRLVLPLKSDENYYPHTRYGYARGNEPVIFVQRIRNYQSVISTAFE